MKKLFAALAIIFLFTNVALASPQCSTAIEQKLKESDTADLQQLPNYYICTMGNNELHPILPNVRDRNTICLYEMETKSLKKAYVSVYLGYHYVPGFIEKVVYRTGDPSTSITKEGDTFTLLKSGIMEPGIPKYSDELTLLYNKADKLMARNIMSGKTNFYSCKRMGPPF